MARLPIDPICVNGQSNTGVTGDERLYLSQPSIYSAAQVQGSEARILDDALLNDSAAKAVVFRLPDEVNCDEALLGLNPREVTLDVNVTDGGYLSGKSFASVLCPYVIDVFRCRSSSIGIRK